MDIQLHLAVRHAETVYRQALLGRVQARATRFGATVALFQALGGGWWNRSSSSNVSAAEQVAARQLCSAK
jgi:outer membrane protein TolC